MNKKYIGKALIISGSFILAILLIINGIIYMKNKATVEKFRESIVNTNDSKITNINPGDCIGVLEIPKIDLSLAINEGTDNKNIKYTLGHFINTPMPWEDGNFSVAGHRGYTYGQLLNRLNEVSIDDMIKVITQNGTFEYKVYDIDVVLPEEVDVLKSNNERIITMITCTPIYRGTHRLVVKGILASEY